MGGLVSPATYAQTLASKFDLKLQEEDESVNHFVNRIYTSMLDIDEKLADSLKDIVGRHQIKYNTTICIDE